MGREDGWMTGTFGGRSTRRYGSSCGVSTCLAFDSAPDVVDFSRWPLGTARRALLACFSAGLFPFPAYLNRLRRDNLGHGRVCRRKRMMKSRKEARSTQKSYQWPLVEFAADSDNDICSR